MRSYAELTEHEQELIRSMLLTCLTSLEQFHDTPNTAMGYIADSCLEGVVQEITKLGCAQSITPERTKQFCEIQRRGYADELGEQIEINAERAKVARLENLEKAQAKLAENKAARTTGIKRAASRPGKAKAKVKAAKAVAVDDAVDDTDVYEVDDAD